jgi:hypothetical protein
MFVDTRSFELSRINFLLFLDIAISKDNLPALLAKEDAGDVLVPYAQLEDVIICSISRSSSACTWRKWDTPTRGRSFVGLLIAQDNHNRITSLLPHCFSRWLVTYSRLPCEI